MALNAAEGEGIENAARWSAPRLACDLPIERERTFVHNELLLSGWAASPVGISGVIVQVDERLMHASYGLDTPWLAESLPEVAGSDRAGYRLQIDTSTWAPGPRQVTVTAYDQDGGRSDVAGEVDVVPFVEPRYTAEENLAAIEAGELAMWLERPSPAESAPEVEAPVEIAGWAYARGGVGAVLVTIDGKIRAEALQPVFRPDLVDEYGEEVARQAGFVLRLDPRECPPGWHRLSVVATAGDLRAVGLEVDFHCLPKRPPAEIPAPGEAMTIQWRPKARIPRPSVAGTDAVLGGEALRDAERELRRQVAARLAADRDVLDVGPADLPALAHDDASFDLIVCFDAIEHVADHGAALDELRRVLRADGVLLVAAPRREGAQGVAGVLERALRDRFANVRVARQRALLASLIADDDTLAREGAMGEELEIFKRGQGRPGGEDQMLALAGDGELPELPPMALLAPPSAVRQLRGTIAMWRDRALLAEADAAASRNQANLARMHQEATLRELRDAEHELGTLRQALRDAIAQRDEQAAQRDEQAAQRASLAAEQEDLRARLEVAERRATEAETASAALEASSSWRLTRPLRAVKRWLA